MTLPSTAKCIHTTASSTPKPGKAGTKQGKQINHRTPEITEKKTRNVAERKDFPASSVIIWNSSCSLLSAKKTSFLCVAASLRATLF